jgi:acyl-coenzyme A synthetase/AMP-(fatty) acid ligase
VVVFTSSGTTGQAKLIPSSAAMIFRQAPLNPPGGRVWHLPAAIEFTRTKRHHLHGLSQGATLLLGSAAAGAPLHETCAAHAVERLLLAPHQAASLPDQVPPGAWPRHTRLHLSGAPVPGALRHRLQAALTPEVYVAFGATEFGIASWAGPADHGVHPDGLGRAPPGVDLAVVDPDGAAVPDGTLGVLRVRSPGCIAHYLDDPAADARALRDGWFHTGDVVRRTADGTLLFGGREDDMMILGTINIFPQEIERAATGFPGIADCAAFALRGAALGDIPALAVVPAGGAMPDTAALLAHCRAQLGVRAPRRVILLPALPRNAAGKVRRQDLAAMAAPGPATHRS